MSSPMDQCSAECQCDNFLPLLTILCKRDFRIVKSLLSVMDVTREAHAVSALIRVMEHRCPSDLIALLRSLATDEVRQYNADFTLYLRDNQCPSTKFFQLFIQHHGKSLVKGVAKGLSRTLKTKMSMEVNPAAVKSDEERLENRENLIKVCSSILDCVLRRVKRIPSALAALCAVLQAQHHRAVEEIQLARLYDRADGTRDEESDPSTSSGGGSSEDEVEAAVRVKRRSRARRRSESVQEKGSPAAISIVASVVFLKLVCPFLCGTEAYEGVPEEAMPSLRESTLLVKVLQRAANGVLFDHDSHLAPLNVMLDEYHVLFRNYAAKIVKRGHAMEPEEISSLAVRDHRDLARDWLLLFNLFRRRFTDLQQILLTSPSSDMEEEEEEAMDGGDDGYEGDREMKRQSVSKGLSLSAEEEMCTSMVRVRNSVAVHAAAMEAMEAEVALGTSPVKKKRKLGKSKTLTIDSRRASLTGKSSATTSSRLDALLSPRSSDSYIKRGFTGDRGGRKLTPFFRKESEDTDRLLAHCVSEKDLRKLASQTSEKDLKSLMFGKR